MCLSPAALVTVDDFQGPPGRFQGAAAGPFQETAAAPLDMGAWPMLAWVEGIGLWDRPCGTHRAWIPETFDDFSPQTGMARWQQLDSPRDEQLHLNPDVPGRGGEGINCRLPCANQNGLALVNGEIVL